MKIDKIYWIGVVIGVVLLPVVLASSAQTAVGLAAPGGLMCELLAHPVTTSILDLEPEFSWSLGRTHRESVQTAYQIQVLAEKIGPETDDENVWDSGKVLSSKSSGVSYAGPPLSPGQKYFWQVRVWDQQALVSEYSKLQRFQTAQDIDGYATSRYLPTRTMVRPVRVVEKGEGHYFVDFGKAVFGTVMLESTSEEGGEQIEVHLGEVLADESTIQRKPGGTRRYRKMTVTLKPGTHNYMVKITPDKRNTGSRAIKMPPEVGEVMPFRYCEIVNCPVKLDVSKIRQIAVHYPFDDSASRFSSSSDVLNDVWDLCKYSIKATSFCGVYVDGDRERIPYEADAYINQLSHYCVDREYSMARYSHEYLMTHATWPTEWILHSVLMAWADYLYTGDSESVEHYYDDLKAKTLLSLARDDGLISTQTDLVTDELLASIHLKDRLRDIVDWPHGNILGLKGGYGETDDFEFKPINTVVNAFHYRALVLMSRMAADIGKERDAEHFAKAATRVKESFNRVLLDKDKGIYVDGEGSEHSALHANMFPLAFGLVPPEHIRSVAQFIKSRGMVCSVYGSQYLLEALYEAGEDEYALKLMTDTETDRSWPHMIYDVGTTITLEAWDNKYKPNQDWNHAWGAAPANIIPRYLMGVQPLEPGFAKVRIKPQVGSLRQGSLIHPTVRGPMGVNFESKPNQSFVLVVDIPANTQAVVYLPRMDRDGTDVDSSGTEIEGEIEGNFLVLDNVGPGLHRFERKR